MDISKIQAQYPDFCKEVQNLPAADLKARIVALQEGLQQSEDAKAADEDLQAAKAQAKELAAPYSDVKKAVKAKTQYLLSLLAER